MIEALKELYYRFFIARKSGLLPDEPDERDFDIENLGGWGKPYEPKHKRQEIKTLSVKNQKGLYTCVMNATTIQKEIDEGVISSVRSLVTYAVKNRLCGYKGLSSLRNNQKMIKDWGIQTEDQIPDVDKNNWNKYVGITLNDVQAGEHKSKTYWNVKKRDDILKLLDGGRPIVSAMDWYSGWNRSRLPSNGLITGYIGYSVGGHSIIRIGYDMDYNGRKVYIFQNSYSGDYGVKTDVNPNGGIFYVDMDFADRVMFPSYVNLDVDKDLGKLVTTLSYKNVMSYDSNAVYMVYAGKKHVYKDMDTYVMYNTSEKVTFGNILKIPQVDLDLIPEGDPMNKELSKHFKYYDKLVKPVKYK